MVHVLVVCMTVSEKRNFNYILQKRVCKFGKFQSCSYSVTTNPSPKFTFILSFRLINWDKHLSGTVPKLLPKRNFKEPTRPKAEKLGAQHVKC